MRNAILTLLLFGLLAAHANPAGFYEGLTMARLRGNAVVASDAWADAGLNTGLVSYWAMRTNTAANVVTDEYGTNTGTAVNSPVFSAANGVRDDGAGLSKASTQHVSAASSVVSGLTTATFAMWVKTTNKADNDSYLSQFRTSDNNRVFWLRAVTLGDGIGAVIQANAYKDGGFLNIRSAYIPANSVTNGLWRHVVWTFDSTNWQAYVNGAALSTTNQTSGTGASGFYNGTSKVYIGNTESLSGNMNGSIDEVAIWNRALSSNEVFNLYSTPLYAPYKP